MNESKMRRILKLLESEGLIVRKSAGKVTDKVTEKPTDKTTKSGTVITVVNYGVQGHDNNQDDEETDEETDEECDGQTDDSIIKKKEYRTSNNREICVKENLVNLVEPAKAKASTRQTRPSFDNSRIAKISAGLHERGYQHTGHGAGGEYGLIGSLLKQGYTEEQLLSAAEIAAESKENRPDHIDDYTAFLVSILRDQFGTGSDDVPCVIRDESIPDWD